MQEGTHSQQQRDVYNVLLLLLYNAAASLPPASWNVREATAAIEQRGPPYTSSQLPSACWRFFPGLSKPQLLAVAKHRDVSKKRMVIGQAADTAPRGGTLRGRSGTGAMAGACAVGAVSASATSAGSVVSGG